MRFYVASSSDDEGIRRTRELIAKAQAAGHECTCDWTLIVDRERAQAATDGVVPNPVLYRGAVLDRAGVRDAEVLIYLMPTRKSEGAAWELGYAHAMHEGSGRGCTLVVGTQPGCLFTLLEGDWMPDIDSAVQWLTALEPGSDTMPLAVAGRRAREVRE